MMLGNDAVEKLAQWCDLATLDAEDASIALVDAGGAILWVNDAWRRFGATNGAVLRSIDVGANYFAATLGEVHTWICSIASSSIESGDAFESDYECSSPTTRRSFRMRMLPIPEVGLLIRHSLRREVPRTGVAAESVLATYRTGDTILMCSNCRHVRRNDGATWDWIPDWLASPPPEPVSHGLCALCLEFYYK